jgi:dipeptidyl aminopeptidase/acylaminoacyl peptidase
MKQIRKLTRFAFLLTLGVSACTPAPNNPTPVPISVVSSPVPIQATGLSSQAALPIQPSIAAATPTLPADLPLSGEIYFALAKRENSTSNKVSLTLSHLSAGCIWCPPPSVVPGFDSTIQDIGPFVWSPDGRYAAFTSTTLNNSKSSLILFNPVDNSFKTLVQIQSLGPDLYWSQDGQWLAFQGQEKSKLDLYVIHPDGSKLTNLTKDSLGDINVINLAGWLKDQLVFTGGNSAGYFAYSILINNRLPHKLSNLQVFRGYGIGQPAMRISPDNHWIAYTEINPEVGSILSVLSLKEGVASRAVETFKDGVIEGYTWSPQGDWLTFWMAIEGQTQVYLVHPDSSEFHSVFSDTTIRSVIFNPRGEDFLLVETGGDHSRLVYVPLTTPGQPAIVRAAGVEGVAWEAASWRP